jgi:thiamine pyrophosphokinase
MPRIILFANGIIPSLESARSLLLPDDFLLGVDAGTHHIFALDLQPHLVIGDLDSLDEDELYELGRADIPIQQYPSDKNETDLELALEYAIEAGYSEIIIIAALGDRLDQTLGNLSLLTDTRLSPLDVRINDGVEEVFFCRKRAEVKGRSGDIVSLIPWGGEVTGVVTQNLKWPLYGEILYSSKTRGISN